MLPIIMLVLAWVLLYVGKERDLFGAIMAGMIFAGFAGIMLLLWPLHYYGTKGEIKQFESVRQTLETARANKTISPYELAAIQQKVVESNEWLAGVKYGNGTIVGYMYPDEVMDIEPIK